jgi:hypothetical protein
VIPTTDASQLHTVNGAAGTAWIDAPESGNLGWTTDGNAALGVFGTNDSGCGTSLDAPFDVYVVSPDGRTNPRLILPLDKTQFAQRWTSLGYTRTP